MPLKFAALSLLLLVGCERTVYVARGPEAGVADPCAGAPTEWLFCAAFEEGDFASWDDLDGNPSSTNQLLADPGPGGHAGNHVARLIPLAGIGGADLVAELPPASGPVWVRWFAWWEPGFDLTVVNRGAGLHAGDRGLLGVSGSRPSGADRFDALVGTSNDTGAIEITTYYAGMYQEDCTGTSTSCSRDRLPCAHGLPYCSHPEDLPHAEIVPATGRWTCVELLVDPGTPTPDPTGASGRMDVWIDGVEVGPFENRWMRSTDALVPTVLWMSLYYSSADHPDVGMRIDDVAVSTSRIGCTPL